MVLWRHRTLTTYLGVAVNKEAAMVNPLEQFFLSDKARFSLYTWNYISNCCSAIMQGEPYSASDDKLLGRCNDCKEFAEFEKEQ
jgi:hypothetical protein